MPKTASNALLFARNFFKYPRLLGSVVPSSPFLVDQVLGHVDWPSARLIVEYGPGVGTFTGQILRRMSPEARLVAIELNPEFVEYLSSRYPDPRLEIVPGSAADVDTLVRGVIDRDEVDVIISGIPFSMLQVELRRDILSKTAKVLAPAGRFLVYQYSRAVLPHLRANFSEIHEEFVPFNILPARVYACRK